MMAKAVSVFQVAGWVVVDMEAWREFSNFVAGLLVVLTS
jgi:hypothetical protein